MMFIAKKMTTDLVSESTNCLLLIRVYLWTEPVLIVQLFDLIQTNLPFLYPHRNCQKTYGFQRV